MILQIHILKFINNFYIYNYYQLGMNKKYITIGAIALLQLILIGWLIRTTFYFQKQPPCDQTFNINVKFIGDSDQDASIFQKRKEQLQLAVKQLKESSKPTPLNQNDTCFKYQKKINEISTDINTLKQTNQQCRQQQQQLTEKLALIRQALETAQKVECPAFVNDCSICEQPICPQKICEEPAQINCPICEQCKQCPLPVVCPPEKICNQPEPCVIPSPVPCPPQKICQEVKDCDCPAQVDCKSSCNEHKNTIQRLTSDNQGLSKKLQQVEKEQQQCIGDKKKAEGEWNKKLQSIKGSFSTQLKSIITQFQATLKHEDNKNDKFLKTSTALTNLKQQLQRSDFQTVSIAVQTYRSIISTLLTEASQASTWIIRSRELARKRQQQLKIMMNALKQCEQEIKQL